MADVLTERLRASPARILVGAGLGALLGCAAYFTLRTPASLGAPLVMALVGAAIWGVGGNVTLIARDDALEVARLGRRERIPWAEIEQLIATTVILKRTRNLAKPDHAIPMFELTYGGGRVLKTPSPDAAQVERLGKLIAERAQLEWIEMKIAGRVMPTMALRPEAVARLRKAAAEAEESPKK